MNQNKKIRIVFVDDEQRILDGLRRMLHNMRNEWEMEFANSAFYALKIMQDSPVDIIVSDMRMPEMDGSQLLCIVKKLYPQTIRFILSGHSDKEMIMKTLGATDQFLVKPCDVEVLKRVISKAISPNESEKRSNIRKIISSMESLPVLPDLYKKLKDKINEENSSCNDISEIIKHDIAICTKILQLVNSSFFGLQHHIQSLPQAVAFLGMDTVKSIIITEGIFNEFKKEEIDKFAIKELYNHSLSVGSLTGKIVKSVISDDKIIDASITAGMLHDIGKLIFIKNKSETYEEIYKKHKKDKIPLNMLENQYFGATHAEAGACLMELWGFPENLIKTVYYHHNPIETEDSSFNIVTAVYIANILEHESEQTAAQLSYEMDLKYLEKLNLLESIAKWRQLAVDSKTLCESEKEVTNGTNNS